LVTPDAPAAGTAPLLKVDGISVRYGPITALRDISIDVFPGEAVALIGANGAGKSTLLRTISGLIRPSAGDITYDGASIRGRSPADILRLGIAHSPEGRRLFGSLTVAENLRLGACTRSDPQEIAREIDRIETLFPIIGERRNQTAATLSGGEQQMVALGRALMAQPRILMLDEPSLGVAPLIVQNIFAQLGKMREAGTTILVVEQNMNLALTFATRAYVLRTGRVALHGNAPDLIDDPRVVNAYLGVEQ
jgi:branched-chain amino acid transport system ATP-binding protein